MMGTVNTVDEADDADIVLGVGFGGTFTDFALLKNRTQGLQDGLADMRGTWRASLAFGGSCSCPSGWP